jgi:uncharacterized protein (DUF433 family)
MVALEETIIMPLVVTEQETIRIKGSRVSLDSIVHHFKLGATAEQIVQSFPSLSLGDVYSSIAYYLTHRQEMEVYLEEQKVAADDLQDQLESNPDYRAEIAELRSRILGRWAMVQENGYATPPAWASLSCFGCSLIKISITLSFAVCYFVFQTWMS